MGKPESTTETSGDTPPLTDSERSRLASKMLEAALLQMDDIISASESSNTSATLEYKSNVRDATMNLLKIIKSHPNPPAPPDSLTTEFLLRWLQPERIKKYESENTALRMEVSVLAEQVEAQAKKIEELEEILREKTNSLARTEEILQREVVARSALETRKLELLSSLAEAKLRQAGLEQENLTLRNGGERFTRQTGRYCSLPRTACVGKRGVAFAEEETTIMKDQHSQSKPLMELTVDEISVWLSNLGLECYVPEFNRWRTTGAKLIEAPQQVLEKELELKNPLHRKKLFLAIEWEKVHGQGFCGSEKMDNSTVLRWLDDIGLPQHKEAFQSARVDGRVLHRLTTEDLFNLGVTAQLHAASLRRGIQVLREQNFILSALERRSPSGNGADATDVHLWTNHRVMEWLRVVDLAEYAPNMRGSGVHGALIIYEDKFTSELLASLLSISPGKTLLRRHLTTHFNQIIGREVVVRKREAEAAGAGAVLTVTARLKVPKKSQFTLKRKKSKTEVDYGNLVCPLENSPPCTPLPTTPSPGSPNFNSTVF